MREIEFVPESLNPDVMTGHLKIRVPSYTERCEYIASSGIDIDLARNGGPSGIKNLSAIAKILEQTKQFVKSVEFLKSDGTKIETYEELFFDTDFDDVLTELAGKFIGGFRPPKNLKTL